jgi:hypothetical protein
MNRAAPQAEIRMEEPVEEGAGLRLGAVFEAPGARESVWFRFPAAVAGRVRPGADPFLLALLFPAMIAGLPVRVRGRVSPTLLRNVEEYMAIWGMWRPDRYRPVPVAADEEAEPPPPRGPATAAMAFSGGLDSACTAWRHRRGLAGRRTRDVEAGVFVHGFDIPLEQPDVYERARRRNDETLRSVGVETIPLATNFRSLGAEWEESHGTGLAACLALFAGRYGEGLIASSMPYSAPVVAWGSLAVADRFLSTRYFEIVNDGSELTRIDKARIVSDWPEALRGLRVCWKGRQLDTNCCACEKCIRTILEFRAAGVPRPGGFPRDVSDEEIRRTSMVDRASVHCFRRVVDAARHRGVGRESWVQAAEEAIARCAPSGGPGGIPAAPDGGPTDGRGRVRRLWRSVAGAFGARR